MVFLDVTPCSVTCLPDCTTSHPSRLILKPFLSIKCIFVEKERNAYQTGGLGREVLYYRLLTSHLIHKDLLQNCYV
jgi:hypothetical protein